MTNYSILIQVYKKIIILLYGIVTIYKIFKFGLVLMHHQPNKNIHNLIQNKVENKV